MFHAASLALARHCALRKFRAAAKFRHVTVKSAKEKKNINASHDAMQKVWQVQKCLALVRLADFEAGNYSS